MSFSFSKLGVSFGAVLKKSKKRQAKTPLLKIRSTPIALAALPAVFFASRFLPYVTAAVPPLCHFRSENLHFVRGCPKKVEKTSSENTTFENSEHPYRTCGSSGWFFYLFGSSPMSVFLWKTHDFLKSCSNLWCSFGRQLIFIDYHWNLEVSYEKPMICPDYCSNL